jgi:Alpha/beta hydrolase domain
VLSGMPVEGSSIICLLMGSTTPLDADRLAQLYPSRDRYLAEYESATDELIDAGFGLEDDRDQMLDEADPDRIAG